MVDDLCEGTLHTGADIHDGDKGRVTLPRIHCIVDSRHHRA